MQSFFTGPSARIPKPTKFSSSSLSSHKRGYKTLTVAYAGPAGPAFQSSQPGSSRIDEFGNSQLHMEGSSQAEFYQQNKEMLDAQNRAAHMWTLRRYGEFIIEEDHIDEDAIRRIESLAGGCSIDYAHRPLQRMLNAGMTEKQVATAILTLVSNRVIGLNSRVNLLSAHMDTALRDLLNDGVGYDAALDFLACNFHYLTLKEPQWTAFFHSFYGLEHPPLAASLRGENNLATLSAVSSMVRAHLPGEHPRDYLGCSIDELFARIQEAEMKRRGVKLETAKLQGELRKWKNLFRSELVQEYGLFF